MLNKPQSKSTNRNVIAGTCLLLAVAVIAMPGCQAFKSKFSALPKPTFPSASDLAFWKKDSDSVPPPPPSRHLNPSLTEGAEAMLSQNESSNSSDLNVDEYRRKIDEMENSLASAQSKLAGGSGTKPSLGSGSKPTRQPYGDGPTFGSSTNGFKSDLSSNLKSTGNSIDASLKAAQEKAASFGSNSLSDAQQKFNSAIADVKQPAAGGSFRAPSDVLSTKPANDFKQALANTQSQLKSGIDSAKKGTDFNSALGKVNQSLYDMNGQLTSKAANASNPIANTVDAARQRFNSALGTVNDSALEAAKNSAQFGGNLKDKIVSAATEMKPPLRGGDNAFKPAFKAASEPVKTGAQNLLNQARERVSGLGNGFAKAQPPKFAPAVSADAPVSGGGDFSGTRVANVTPVRTQPQGSTVSTRTGLDSSLTKAWGNGSQQSQLKPVEITAPTSMPGNGLRTASAEVSAFGSSTSSASTIPAAFDQNRHAMTSHVSEIDIPSKILSGNGSYAPGSVNKVR